MNISKVFLKLSTIYLKGLGDTIKKGFYVRMLQRRFQEHFTSINLWHILLEEIDTQEELSVILIAPHLAKGNQRDCNVFKILLLHNCLKILPE